MSNLIQEPSESQNPEEPFDPFDSRFSMLCLNPSAVNSAAVHAPLCSSCGRRPPRSAATPMKRRSPTPSQDPTTKKLFLDHQQQQQQNLLTSFSKIDLPIPFGPSSAQPSSFSPLRRSVSDPTEARNFSPPSPAKRSCPNSTLPPLPLRRTVSDPNPSPDKPSESPIKFGTIKEDSPDSKRLRRIKERLKEMNQWWNEVMSEQEHLEEDRAGNEIKKSKEEVEDEEETVGVERVGDSLELRFKCPCGKGFEILLSGTSCFYKLL